MNWRTRLERWATFDRRSACLQEGCTRVYRSCGVGTMGDASSRRARYRMGGHGTEPSLTITVMWAFNSLLDTSRGFDLMVVLEV